jgi:hypothetical protein
MQRAEAVPKQRRRPIKVSFANSENATSPGGRRCCSVFFGAWSAHEYLRRVDATEKLARKREDSEDRRVEFTPDVLLAQFFPHACQRLRIYAG